MDIYVDRKQIKIGEVLIVHCSREEQDVDTSNQIKDLAKSMLESRLV